tara:strand:- start:3004 stop:4785 length:1782 start_codon:yes stop_codon:yes gene_type:complete
MFAANNTNQQFVPNKQIILKPELQGTYSPLQNNQIKFNIPSYIGYVDPAHINLNMRITMMGRGSLHPDGSAGMWSLIRDLRIQSGDGRTQLEDISDLNVLCAQMWGFNQNDSINAKRELLEGMSVNGANDAQLYWQPPPAAAGPRTSNGDPIEVQCSGPIPMSGTIGTSATSVFPLAGTSGLRIQMNVETLTRSCVLANRAGVSYDPHTPYAAGGAGRLADVQFTSYLLFGDKAGADDVAVAPPAAAEFTVDICRTADRAAAATGAGAGLEKYIKRSVCDDDNECGVCIGDMVYIAESDGTHCQSLGQVTEISIDATGAGGLDRFRIKYIPNRAAGQDLGHTYTGCDGGTANVGGPVVFFDPTDRIKWPDATSSARTGLEPPEDSSVRITEVELSVLQVEPPAGYVEAMMKQINGAGLPIDYCTSTLYRHNLPNPIGLQSAFIPANQQRAYSLISVPLIQGALNDTTISSLRAEYEEQPQLNYQWVFDGDTTPDRPVDMEKYDVGKNAILHIMECEKAIENAKVPVRNLQAMRTRIIIARALSRYGQVHSLQGKSTMLRIAYPNEEGESTLLETYCVHLNRMIITAGGIEVIR